MTTRKVVVFLLEDCVQRGLALTGKTRAADLLATNAPIGRFPQNGDPLAELIARGHAVVVASALSAATLSTAVHLYDLEYHALKAFNQPGPVTGKQLRDWASAGEWSANPELGFGQCEIVSSALTGPNAHDPATFFRSYRKLDAFGAVTSGRRATNTAADAPEAPDPAHPLYRLHEELTRPDGWRLKHVNQLALDACEAASNSMTRAQAAYWSLAAAPGLPDRGSLQRHLLEALVANVVPYRKEDFYCLEQRTHCFQFHPHLLTRREYRTDAHLRDLYLRSLSVLFPSCSASGVHPRMPDVRAVTEYVSRKHGGFGSVMGVAKDWQWTPSPRPGAHGSSGPNPALSYLPFSAELMAAHTPKHEKLFFVAAPATAYSRQRPGEVSRRLGDLVGEIRGVPVRHILQKVPGGVSCQSAGKGDAWLLDDQVTSGRTLTDASNALKNGGYAVLGGTAFSTGSRNAAGISVTLPKPSAFSVRLQGVTVPVPHAGTRRRQA